MNDFPLNPDVDPNDKSNVEQNIFITFDKVVCELVKWQKCTEQKIPNARNKYLLWKIVENCGIHKD